MNCKACERDKFIEENPDVIINLSAKAHSCDQPERSKREDHPNGSIWQNSSSYKKQDEKYDFYGMLNNKWHFLGRFGHWIDVNWDGCGALNTQVTE